MAFELWVVGAARKWGRSEEELSQITTLMEAKKMYTQIEDEMARLRAEGRQEGHQEGRQKGRQEGHQEGRQEGRQEGSRTVLERLVAKKFGEDAAVQLSGLIGSLHGRDQLDAAADAIIECDTVAELVARLAN